MQESKPTGRIKIIKLPRGDWPIAIRTQWIGLTLPCDALALFEGTGQYVFYVPQEAGLKVLEADNPVAADWFKERKFPQKGGWFCFGEDEAVIVSGVFRKKFTLVTEEMMGHPDR